MNRAALGLYQGGGVIRVIRELLGLYVGCIRVAKVLYGLVGGVKGCSGYCGY